MEIQKVQLESRSPAKNSKKVLKPQEPLPNTELPNEQMNQIIQDKSSNFVKIRGKFKPLMETEQENRQSHPKKSPNKRDIFDTEQLDGKILDILDQEKPKEQLSTKYMGVVNGKLGILSHKVNVDSVQMHYQNKLKKMQTQMGKHLERNEKQLQNRTKISSSYSITDYQQQKICPPSFEPKDEGQQSLNSESQEQNKELILINCSIPNESVQVNTDAFRRGTIQNQKSSQESENSIQKSQNQPSNQISRCQSSKATSKRKTTPMGVSCQVSSLGKISPLDLTQQSFENLITMSGLKGNKYAITPANIADLTPTYQSPRQQIRVDSSKKNGLPQQSNKNVRGMSVQKSPKNHQILGVIGQKAKQNLPLQAYHKTVLNKNVNSKNIRPQQSNIVHKFKQKPNQFKPVLGSAFKDIPQQKDVTEMQTNLNIVEKTCLVSEKSRSFSQDNQSDFRQNLKFRNENDNTIESLSVDKEILQNQLPRSISTNNLIRFSTIQQVQTNQQSQKVLVGDQTPKNGRNEGLIEFLNKQAVTSVKIPEQGASPRRSSEYLPSKEGQEVECISMALNDSIFHQFDLERTDFANQASIFDLGGKSKKVLQIEDLDVKAPGAKKRLTKKSKRGSIKSSKATPRRSEKRQIIIDAQINIKLVPPKVAESAKSKEPALEEKKVIKTNQSTLQQSLLNSSRKLIQEVDKFNFRTKVVASSTTNNATKKGDKSNIFAKEQKQSAPTFEDKDTNFFNYGNSQEIQTGNKRDQSSLTRKKFRKLKRYVLPSAMRQHVISDVLRAAKKEHQQTEKCKDQTIENQSVFNSQQKETNSSIVDQNLKNTKDQITNVRAKSHEKSQPKFVRPPNQLSSQQFVQGIQLPTIRMNTSRKSEQGGIINHEQIGKLRVGMRHSHSVFGLASREVQNQFIEQNPQKSSYLNPINSLAVHKFSLPNGLKSCRRSMQVPQQETSCDDPKLAELSKCVKLSKLDNKKSKKKSRQANPIFQSVPQINLEDQNDHVLFIQPETTEIGGVNIKSPARIKTKIDQTGLLNQFTPQSQTTILLQRSNQKSKTQLDNSKIQDIKMVDNSKHDNLREQKASADFSSTDFNMPVILPPNGLYNNLEPVLKNSYANLQDLPIVNQDVTNLQTNDDKIDQESLTVTGKDKDVFDEKVCVSSVEKNDKSNQIQTQQYALPGRKLIIGSKNQLKYVEVGNRLRTSRPSKDAHEIDLTKAQNQGQMKQKSSQRVEQSKERQSRSKLLQKLKRKQPYWQRKSFLFKTENPQQNTYETNTVENLPQTIYNEETPMHQQQAQNNFDGQNISHDSQNLPKTSSRSQIREDEAKDKEFDFMRLVEKIAHKKRQLLTGRSDFLSKSQFQNRHSQVNILLSGLANRKSFPTDYQNQPTIHKSSERVPSLNSAPIPDLIEVNNQEFPPSNKKVLKLQKRKKSRESSRAKKSSIREANSQSEQKEVIRGNQMHLSARQEMFRDFVQGKEKSQIQESQSVVDLVLKYNSEAQKIQKTISNPTLLTTIKDEEGNDLIEVSNPEINENSGFATNQVQDKLLEQQQKSDLCEQVEQRQEKVENSPDQIREKQNVIRVQFEESVRNFLESNKKQANLQIQADKRRQVILQNGVRLNNVEQNHQNASN